MIKDSGRFDERVSVGFSDEQTRQMEEVIRVRARRGHRLSKSDLVRQAWDFYTMHQEDLPGSRRAIAKSVEGKLAEVDVKLIHLTTRLDEMTKAFNEFVDLFRTPEAGHES